MADSISYPDFITAIAANTVQDQKGLINDFLLSGAGVGGSVLTNTTIDAKLNTIKNAGYADAYVFVDSGGYVGIMNRSGTVYTHPTNADVVLNNVYNDLSSGSSIQGSGPNLNMYTGGKYGSIFVGPGTYNLFSSVILQPQIMLRGSGAINTRFQLANSVGNNHNSIMFKSSTWDTHSFQAGSLTAGQRQQGDPGIILRDFDVYGNQTNQSFGTNVVATPGVESWGHGICIYVSGGGGIIENVGVHQCAGVGLILQGTGTNYGTTGLPTGDQGFVLQSPYVHNVLLNGNGQQGFLCRTSMNTYNLWTDFNGEAGVEVQDCAFFAGSSSRFLYDWHFLDGKNHSSAVDSGSYDATAYEFMLAGPCFMYNCWVEGPYYYGDSLVVGRPGAIGNSVDYTLANPGGGSDVRNCMGDACKASAILVNTPANTIQMRINAPHNAINGIPTDHSTGCTVLAPSNILDLTPNNFSQASTQNCLTVGAAGTAVAGNTIRLRTQGSTNYINWANSGNLANVIYLETFASAGQNIFTPGSANRAVSNIISVQGASEGLAFNGSNNGKFTANGGGTTFTIAHGLYTTPNYVNIRPGSSDAAAIAMYATADGTNVTANYASSTNSGTNNIVLYWEAKVPNQP